MRAVLDELNGLGLLMVDGYADLDARRLRHPGDRGGQVPDPHHLCGAGRARILDAPLVRHRRMPAADAADLIRRIAGRYRLPDALRRADTVAPAGPPQPPLTDRHPADPRRRAERRSLVRS